MKKIGIFSVKTDCGASKSGADLGPDAIKNNGLANFLSQNEYSVDETTIVATPNSLCEPNLKNCGMVAEVNGKLYRAVKQSLSEGCFPLTLGGDHSIAAGSVSAVSSHYKNIGVVWVDAHGDWNDQTSSETGNMHGMSFSAACGHGPDCMARFDDEFVAVDPHRCVLIGARDLDKDEKIRIKNAGVTVITTEDAQRIGVAETVRQALNVVLKGTQGFHLSFDVDCIGPEEAPGTGTIAANGLTAEQATQIALGLAKSGKLLALDVVEVNPLLDEDDKTSKLAAEITAKLLECVKQN